MGEKENKIIVDRLQNLENHERLFRINAGSGWVGETVKHSGKFITLKYPQPLHAAPKGWPDLCGWESVTITPDMVGQTVAIFTGEEIKATGKLSPEQNKFKDIILRMGGRFRVLRN